MENDIFRGVGVVVKLTTSDDFLKVKETLTRIGVPSKIGNKLFQSCHILHKQGQYAIVHFKELFKLDGKQDTISDEDIARRNTIATLLQQWGLISILDPAPLTPLIEVTQLKILSHKEKTQWELVSKYNIGRKR